MPSTCTARSRPSTSGVPRPSAARCAHVRQRLTDEGELLVGGPGLASGYPGLPEATDERFVELDGERWFRTGDLVREDALGLLHGCGRLDAQVKVRGIRVDPGEVESHLLRHLGVAAAAVLGVVVADRTALAAYVVSAPSATGDLVAAIRGFLREHAPSHLHPARITVVPDLVLTTSGKVDRRATHALYGAPHPKGHPVSPPAITQPLTQPATIVAIFRRVLEDDDIGDATDFFEAGGDSLLATRVLSAIAREYDVELTFDEFVVGPSPAALAALVEGRRP